MTEPHPNSEFVAKAAGDLAAQGFPRMPGYVLMALMASDDGRLTAAELAEQLEVSPAAISNAVGYLTTLGFIRTETVPGSRRHVYALPDVPWYTVTLGRPRYDHMATLVRAAAQSLPAGSAALGRVEQMADFYDFIGERMPRLFAEWRDRPQP